MDAKRYLKRQGEDDTWSLVDTVTGRTAEMGSRQLSGLNAADAADLLETLNAPRPTALHTADT
jgi:hypothetical protein